MTHQNERGGLLSGALLVMLALGCLAAVVLKVSSLPGSSSTQTGTTLGAGSPSGAVNAAVVAACRSDFEAVQRAVDVYEAETGSGPTNIKQLQSLLHGVVVTSRYTITIDRNLAGEIDVATPSHPASPGESNCAYAGQ